MTKSHSLCKKIQAEGALCMDTNLQKYLAFVKTAELGSFSRAALALSYSQSGVSRMIGDLERELGITLLARGKDGVRLTAEGERLLPYAERLAHDFRRLETEAAELKGLQTGCIRIGTFSSVATHWLPHMIQAFQRDYPGIEYELLLGDYTEITRWILDGRVDCGFLRLPAGDGLEAVFLERDALLAVIPENHPLAACAVFPVEALQDAPFMLLEKGERAEITDVLERNHLKADIRFTTWDDYAVMSMVECGLGISILPELILRRAPYRILTKPLSVPAWREIGFCYRAASASLAVRRFAAYLPYRQAAPSK